LKKVSAVINQDSKIFRIICGLTLLDEMA